MCDSHLYADNQYEYLRGKSDDSFYVWKRAPLPGPISVPVIYYTMLLEYYIIAQENAPTPVLLRIMIAVVAVPLAGGLLVLSNLLPGTMGQGILWLVVAAAAALYFLGWRLPVQYVLTDTHLLVKRGFAKRIGVPLDQIQVICEALRGDELVYSGFTALGEKGQPIIINPHRPPRFRVALTPTEGLVEELFWLIRRTEFDPMPT